MDNVDAARGLLRHLEKMIIDWQRLADEDLNIWEDDPRRRLFLGTVTISIDR